MWKGRIGMRKFTSHQKFNEDKTYRYFPGISIAKMFGDHQLVKLIAEVKEDMERSGHFEQFVFLPKSSYHMTICDLLTYNDLDTNLKFKEFELKNEKDPLRLDRYVSALLGTEEFPLNVVMKVKAIKERKLSLIPYSEEDATKLAQFRKRMGETLKIFMDPGYQFHISLSYQLFSLDENEQRALGHFMCELNDKYLHRFTKIAIDTATLVAFNDMYQFREPSLGREDLGCSYNWKR